MGKKIALNVFYTICIFLCVVVAYEGIEYKRYEYTIGMAFIAIILVVLKIRLLKDVRNIQKKP
ncbi:MAG: DUF6358 family protein [Mucilaginibacter sp.]